MDSIGALIGANSYPGRGIILGRSDDGRFDAAAYFIMGRSANSRNRVFVSDGTTVRTRARDEAAVLDPSLIIYTPVCSHDGTLIVSNGDQTDTILEHLRAGKSFESALFTREYEPDAPHYTPRISGIIKGGCAKLSILRRGDGGGCERSFYEYDLTPGEGRLIHTYAHDGAVLPPFSGEPRGVAISGDIDAFAASVWDALDADNRIALYVRFTPRDGGAHIERVINAASNDESARMMELKYGANPNQSPASVSVERGALPFTVLNGRPGYINLLDALNAWRLVRELKAASKLPAAASFKHVSPAGAAVGLALDDIERRMFFVPDDLAPSPIAAAYIRARGADRMSSFGDMAALSDVCDVTTAQYLAREVSDGIIAPGYDPEALEILKRKKRGTYLVLKIDPDYAPLELERREVFGVTFSQRANDGVIPPTILDNVVTANKCFPEEARRDMMIALITTKYTQSNSVCYAFNGQAVGVGAGQQSRIHCVRIAGDKSDKWLLRRHEKTLSLPFIEGLARSSMDNAIDSLLSPADAGALLDSDAWRSLFTEKPEPITPVEAREYLDSVSGLSLASDAFFPFADSILRARKSGVSYLSEPGGSVRDCDVIAAADELGIVMAFTGLRLFHH